MTPDILRASLTGELLLPGDDAYDDRRHGFLREGRPAAIVRCRSHDDIRHGIEYARHSGRLLSIRSGGHSGAGFSTNENGIVLDLSPLDRVDVVDTRRRIVRIGTGATWIDVANALTPHGLAISSGDTTTVGVGGLILGGGIGWLVRKYGLTIDSLVGAEVVTADGRVLRADADQNAELFWAIRGGGGNFGVVTSFDVVAQPVRDVLFGTVSYPRSEAATVLKRWRDALRVAPDDLTSTVQLAPAGPGMPAACTVAICVPADRSDAASGIVEPLLRLGHVVDQQLATRPYAGVLEEPQPPPPGLDPIAENSLTPDCSDELIDLVMTGIGELGMAAAQFRSLGGAVSRVPSDATAFAHRDSEALVVTALLAGPPEARSAFRSFRQTLAPMTSGSYGNLMNTVEDGDVASLYPPPTYDRLAAVKRDYDPDNDFRHNYNVAPGGASVLR